MAKDDSKIVVEGEVIESLPATKFKVKLNDDFGGHIINEAYVKGKLKQNHIMIMVGDIVELELSPYDLGKGIISKRL